MCYIHENLKGTPGGPSHVPSEYLMVIGVLSIIEGRLADNRFNLYIVKLKGSIRSDIDFMLMIIWEKTVRDPCATL